MSRSIPVLMRDVAERSNSSIGTFSVISEICPWDVPDSSCDFSRARVPTQTFAAALPYDGE